MLAVRLADQADASFDIFGLVDWQSGCQKGHCFAPQVLSGCPACLTASFGLLLERFIKPAGCFLRRAVSNGGWVMAASCFGQATLAGHQTDVGLPCLAHAETTCFLALSRETNKAQSAGCCRQCLRCTREAAKRRFLARRNCASFVISVFVELSCCAGHNLCYRSWLILAVQKEMLIAARHVLHLAPTRPCHQHTIVPTQ